jgi:hypothetical protein
MLTRVAQISAADAARALDSLRGRSTPSARRVASLPVQHTDFVWAVEGAAGWARVAGAIALPLLGGFALGWWARGRRRAA